MKLAPGNTWKGILMLPLPLLIIIIGIVVIPYLPKLLSKITRIFKSLGNPATICVNFCTN